MKRALVLAASLLAGVGIFGDTACGHDFGGNPSNERLEVTITDGPQSSSSARIPLSFTVPQSYKLSIRALRADGTVDTSFNGYVRLSAQPGSVQVASGPNISGRNALLHNGSVDGVQVQLLAAYGDARIWAEDVGYVPADPSRVCTNGVPFSYGGKTVTTCPTECPSGKPCPPQCANSLDDNDNGLIDHPADHGCYLANDDTEDGGSYTAGISPTLYYYIPRIADVRGAPQGGTGTPFPSQAVNIDCGYRGPGQYAFDVIVTRVSAAGFYVTDLAENPTGFGSVYAFNFNAPPNMRQCDRLRSFGGTTSDFYGFTEVNYPTWQIEEWDPSVRPCGVPEPHTLAQTCTPAGPTGPAIPDCVPIPLQGTNSTAMLSVSAALVRVGTTAVPATATSPGVAGTRIHITKKFGPGHPAAPAYTPTADATDCDLNNSGKVERTPTTNPELACANACQADPECSEYTNFLSQNQFNLVVETWVPDPTSPTGFSAASPTGSVNIQADGSTDAQFSPVLLKGQYVGAFAGTLAYFSGGSQFTIQARCADDIVVPVDGAPIPSDTACVHARTILDTSAGSN